MSTILDASTTKLSLNWFISFVPDSIKKLIDRGLNGLGIRTPPSVYIKRIVLMSIIIYCVFSFRHLTKHFSATTKNTLNNANTSLFYNRTKSMQHVTVEMLFHNKIFDKNYTNLTAFSGVYEDVPAILTMNKTIHKYDIEEIYFAVTTNTKRILDTAHYLKFWTKIPGIKCLIVFEQKDFAGNSNITEYLVGERIPCKIQSSNETHYETRYHELFQTLWNNEVTNNTYTGRKRIQWFVVGDDDTVWFINNLLRTLQQYNSSDSIYLGDVSNKVSQLSRHGDFFAYGGGGIILSRPLAILFAEHTQKCKTLTGDYGGDGVIGKCVTAMLNVTLTKNNNFHQMDYSGDLTGFFEGGIDGLVTLHHMFSVWKPFPDGHSDKLNKTMYLLDIAYETLDDKFLKRYVRLNYKTNQTLLLTLGYSFSVFDRILSHSELIQLENTWCCGEMATRKSRPKETSKATWYFQDLSYNNTSDRKIRRRTIDKHKYEIGSQFPTYKNNINTLNVHFNIVENKTSRVFSIIFPIQ